MDPSVLPRVMESVGANVFVPRLLGLLAHHSWRKWERFHDLRAVDEHLMQRYRHMVPLVEADVELSRRRAVGLEAGNRYAVTGGQGLQDDGEAVDQVLVDVCDFSKQLFPAESPTSGVAVVGGTSRRSGHVDPQPHLLPEELLQLGLSPGALLTVVLRLVPPLLQPQLVGYMEHRLKEPYPEVETAQAECHVLRADRQLPDVSQAVHHDWCGATQ